MQIHHLNCGTFAPMGRAFMNGNGSPFRSGRLICHCLAIETDSGVVLVDTGLGRQDISTPDERLPGKWWRMIIRPTLEPEETMFFQLSRLGLKPSDVRHILLTHLEFDQAGGLSDFPDAQVHVMSVEYEVLRSSRGWIDGERYSLRAISHEPDWVLHDPERGQEWNGFKCVRPLPDVAPEILMIPLPGHTRGHAGVAIQRGADWLFHVGDAIFHHGELDANRRHCPLGLRLYENVFQYDRAKRLETAERLRQLANHAGRDYTFICSHDPVMLEAPIPVSAKLAYMS